MKSYAVLKPLQPFETRGDVLTLDSNGTLSHQKYYVEDASGIIEKRLSLGQIVWLLNPIDGLKRVEIREQEAIIGDKSEFFQLDSTEMMSQLQIQRRKITAGRYLLFCWDELNPKHCADQIETSFDDRDEAEQWVDDNREDFDRIDVFDRKTGFVVYSVRWVRK